MDILLEFNLILGETIESIPAPVPKPGVELPPPPPAADGPREILRVPQSILLKKTADGWTGVYTHPRWGEQEATDVSVSENHIAFTASSGNDDKNGQTALFSFSFVRSDSTDSVVGFAGGQAPFFRSFLPAEGRIRFVSADTES